MNILLVNKFLTRRGGAETYTLELGRALAGRGHRVEYFGMDSPERDAGNSAGLYVRPLDFRTPGLKQAVYPFKIIYSREAYKKMRRVLTVFDADVVHLNNFNFQLTPSVIAAVRDAGRARGKKIRLLYTAHDSQLLCPDHLFYISHAARVCEKCLHGLPMHCARNRCIHGSSAKSLLAAAEAAVYRFSMLYERIDTIICPSRYMFKKFCTVPRFARKAVFLQNFVLPLTPVPVPRGRYVLYFGRLDAEKGVDLVAEAARLLPDIPFAVAGDGPGTVHFHGLKNVHMAGFLSGQMLQKAISGALVTLCPSRCRENCPLSVLESIALGTPVIGANHGGTPELIEPERTGLLFAPGDAGAMAACIRRVYDDGVLRTRMYTACAGQSFLSADAYCEKVEILYEGGVLR